MTSRTVLLPDVASFGELLEYVCEWDHGTMTSRDAKSPAAPRYIPETGSERNEVGPFCTMENVDGQPRRSMAVRATDLVLEAVAPRIVTPDDHLSFKIYGRPNGKALVILNHNYIIGSHWLAYIDADTIPAYPLEARDAAKRALFAELKAAGKPAYVGTTGQPYEVAVYESLVNQYGSSAGRGPLVGIAHADGSITR